MAVFKPSRSKEEWGNRLITPLYKEKYLETIWNTTDPRFKGRGWTLKSGVWAPWFFNMRPAGSSPDLFYDICTSMSEMILNYHDNIDFIIGIEMAGVPLVGGVSRAMCDEGYPIGMGYTRPLPEKPKTPMKCLELLARIDETVTDYSQKEYVEGRIELARNIGIIDDMATDLGSKLIARLIILWQAKLRGVSINCNEILYFLNRNRGNKQKGLDFENEVELGLYPQKLNVDYVIEFDDHLPVLKNVMRPEEFEIIMEFQQNPKQFGGEDRRREVLAMVK